MYTAERTSVRVELPAAPPAALIPVLEPPLGVAVRLGVAAGAAILIDSAVDAAGVDAVLPNLFGLLTPVLGLFFITGLFAWLHAARPGRLLSIGYVLNLAGLAFVVAIDFARIFALGLLPDAARDVLVEQGPTRPALFAAAALYIVGTVIFGAALIRRRFAPRAAWIYVLTAVPSGLVALLPDVVGAAAQAIAGLAFVGLSLELGRRVRAAAG